jgi:RluA family pseudouridine synthase
LRTLTSLSAILPAREGLHTAEKLNSLTRTVSVPPEAAGLALAAYLAGRFTYQGAEEWAGHAREGRLTLNGAPCRGDETLRARDSISFTPEPWEEPPVDRSYAVLLEDNRYLFVAKPPLLPAHPGGIYRDNTLLSVLAERYGPIRLVNRLDRETSGVVLAAKTAIAAAEANELMRERLIEKEYLVLVEGRFPDRLDAEGFLVKDGSTPVRKKVRFVAASDPAASNPEAIAARTLFTFQGEARPGISLVAARLFTGRTHQIRATLQSLGFPVVGDKLYGKDPTAFLRFAEGRLTEQDKRALRLEHQALHCARLAFTAPDGRHYDVRADVPPSWRSLT